MTLRFTNTLTRTLEPFVPLVPGQVSIYCCGVTVYDLCHLGHARSYLNWDVLRRYLLWRGYAVTYVQNFTDIDDKILRTAAAEGSSMEAVSERNITAYFRDMDALQILRPDRMPRATRCLDGIRALIGELESRGAAYSVDGDVYFSVRSRADYGKLSGRSLEQQQEGASGRTRVEEEERKRHPFDFALWKGARPEEPSFPSPWGPGRPGWHIECSAMIAESLGTTIDIHGGGQDLQFPHHENELAQSTCAHDGAPLAQIWMHNGFLNMGSAEKMSKSLGNIRTIPELQAEGWSGEVLRLALLSAHYRQPLEWTAELLSETKSRLDRWCEAVGDDDSLGGGSVPVSVVEALSDDLNTPAAMRALSELASMIFAASGSERFELRRQFVAAGRLLGIGKLALRTLPSGVSMDWVDTQIAANSAYRAARDFVRADAVRAELASRGIMLVITRDGTTWRRA